MKNSQIDTILLQCITISNYSIYSLTNDPSIIINFLNENNITKNKLKEYLNFLNNLNTILQDKDYELQYNTVFNRTKSIIPPMNMDTTITFEMLDIFQNMDSRDILNLVVNYKEDEIIKQLNMLTINAIKFQVKYALVTINNLIEIL